MLRATARRPIPDGPRGARGQDRPIRRSSNKHLHLAIVIAVAVSSAVAVIIPITRSRASAPLATETSHHSDSVSETLRMQAAGITAALSSTDIDSTGNAAAIVEPPLGAGLFPEPLLSEAARQLVRSAFPGPDGPAALVITRANPVSFTVHEDGFSASYASKRMTVGQALAEQGIHTSEGDLVMPPLNSDLVAGAHVYVRHAFNVQLVVAGTPQSIKTQGRTVAEVLASAGVSLQGLDRVTPRIDKPVRLGMTITVTTVREVTQTVDEAIQYGSVIQYDAELPKGNRVITEGGVNGSIRREYQVRVVNGRETRRQLLSETMIPATDEVVTVGTYVKPAAAPVAVAGAVAAPIASDEMVCSRTLNVYATWYTSASAGGSGVTATGTGVYRGIVAVDPRVIPLGTRMYIPGYGYATAADTGGGIIGNHIDLGFGADEPKDWRTRWVDICIL